MSGPPFPSPPPLPDHLKAFKIASLYNGADFEKMLQTRLLILRFSSMDLDGCRDSTRGLRVHFLGDGKKKKKTCITGRVFGLSPLSEGTFPSPVLQPRHQGLSVKDVPTVSGRLSQPLSCLGKVSYASSIPFCCLFCTLFNTLQTDAMDLSFRKGLTGLISSQLKKKKKKKKLLT